MMLCAADFDELFPRPAEPARAASPVPPARSEGADARVTPMAGGRVRASVRERPLAPFCGSPHPMLCLFALSGVSLVAALEAASLICKLTQAGSSNARRQSSPGSPSQAGRHCAHHTDPQTSQRRGRRHLRALPQDLSVLGFREE